MPKTNPNTNTGVLPWLLFSVTAYNASTGLDPWWEPAWIAPVGLLVVASRLGALRAAAVSWAVLVLGAVRLVPFLAGVMPLPAVLLLLALRALAFVPAVLLARAAMRSLPPAIAVFAFPAAWTALEFAASASPHGTSLSLAYTQAALLPLVQIVSVTGVWGVSFALTLAGSALALSAVRRDPWVLAVPVALLAALLAFGAWRLSTRVASPTVSVGLIATDRGAGELFANEDAKVSLEVVADYLGRVPHLARGGASVVVLPEKLVGVPPGAVRLVTEAVAEAARASRVTIVAGLNLTGVTPRRNVAVAFGPGGARIAEYDKRHLLPGPETGYAIGTRPSRFDAPPAPWGLAICKDMDFPAWLREYGRLGVRLMAVPAWDFVLDGWLHARMAVMRGVENGFAVARTAIEGRLTVSDAYGRVVAETTSDARPFAMLVAPVPAGPGPTIYTRTGDWFGWLSAALACALLAASARLRRSARQTRHD
jgi:apolipoprotein N-acyltransferase